MCEQTHNPKCSSCGSPIKQDSRFCPNCGASTSLDSEQSEETPKCQSCGSPIKKDSRFCPNCGASSSLDIERSEIEATKTEALKPNDSAATNSKSTMKAALFAFLLGPFGVQKFYLGSYGWGLVILGLTILLFPIGTIISGIISWIDFFKFMNMSESEFNTKYAWNSDPWNW